MLASAFDMNNNSTSGRHHSISIDCRSTRSTINRTFVSTASVRDGQHGSQRLSSSPATMVTAATANTSNSTAGASRSCKTNVCDKASVPMLNTPESPALADLRLTLRAASMQTLVEQCVLSFGDDGDTCDPSALPLALFLVHKWYLSSSQLAGLLLQLCRARPPLVPSVCRTVRCWIRLFPEHFDADPELISTMDEIRREAVQGGFAKYSSYLDTTCVPSYEWIRNVSVRNPAARQFSLSFELWTPDEIAISLTHIEFKLLRRITFVEYKQYAFTSQLATVPTLQRSIAVFNSLSQWVQCMVLSKATAKERADIVTKFIRVSKRLQKLKNFNTFMAVVGGLTHSSLARLSKTFTCLSQESRRDLSEFADLLSSNGNFSAYRKAFSDCRGFKIPIIGVHLKDLICLHSAASDYTSEGLVNCRKLAQLAVIFTRLILDIQKPHNLPEANNDLIHTLKVSLDMPYSDDEIYASSLRREPRTLLHPSFHRPAVFADWASGVCSFDPDVMEKHVVAMVDTVFKHYDHDKDGFISQAEFEAVAGNFPLIDSFPVLDTDKDGKISKQEMQRYFLGLSSANRSIECRHNFRETTFLTPAFCFHCKKVLWGLLRQGMKCQDCGLPVHRNCRDAVTTECVRRKQQQIQQQQELQEQQQQRKLDRSSSVAACSATEAAPPSADQAGGECSSASSKPTGASNIKQAGGKPPSVRRPLLSFLSRPRPQRAVSSISPTAEPSPPPSAILFPVGGPKLRSWSESADYFRSASPASEHVPSLASEEVFEIDELSGCACSQAEDGGDTSAECQEEFIGLVLAGCLGLFIVVLLIILAICCCMKRRKEKRTSKGMSKGAANTKSKSKSISPRSQRKRDRQTEAAMMQKQLWMQQLQVLQQTQMAQKPDPVLFELLTDQANTLNYIDLKKETARLIRMRPQIRKSDPCGRSAEDTNAQPDVVAYINSIADERLEANEACAKFGGDSLIRKVVGCRAEKIPIRMDTAVENKPEAVGDVEGLGSEPVRLHMNKMNDYYGKSLILCQAPLPKQFPCHWIAIWEQQVGVVVWIGACVEDEKIKIDPYISLKEGGRVTCGDFRIHTMFAVKFEDQFDVYRVIVKYKKEEGTDRALLFVHVHMWPDHRMPDEPALLADLVAQVQGHQLKQAARDLPALLVHCSLGVQRSPAFVAVYIGRQMWLANHRANLLGILRYVRRHRWRAFAYGDPFAQVQIVFGVMQVIAMRQEMAGICNLTVAAEETRVFDRTARLADAAAGETIELTERLA